MFKRSFFDRNKLAYSENKFINLKKANSDSIFLNKSKSRLAKDLRFLSLQDLLSLEQRLHLKSIKNTENKPISENANHMKAKTSSKYVVPFNGSNLKIELSLRNFFNRISLTSNLDQLRSTTKKTSHNISLNDSELKIKSIGNFNRVSLPDNLDQSKKATKKFSKKHIKDPQLKIKPSLGNFNRVSLPNNLNQSKKADKSRMRKLNDSTEGFAKENHNFKMKYSVKLLEKLKKKNPTKSKLDRTKTLKKSKLEHFNQEKRKQKPSSLASLIKNKPGSKHEYLARIINKRQKTFRIRKKSLETKTSSLIKTSTSLSIQNFFESNYSTYDASMDIINRKSTSNPISSSVSMSTSYIHDHRAEVSCANCEISSNIDISRKISSNSSFQKNIANLLEKNSFLTHLEENGSFFNSILDEKNSNNQNFNQNMSADGRRNILNNRDELTLKLSNYLKQVQLVEKFKPLCINRFTHQLKLTRAFTFSYFKLPAQYKKAI